MDDKTIFRLNDDISFRKCSLFDGEELTFGNCTNFSTLERNWRTYYNWTCQEKCSLKTHKDASGWKNDHVFCSGA